MMTALYWVYLGIALIFFELMTPGLVSIFFGLSALVVALITYLVPGMPEYLQWILFSIFSVLFILLLRKTLKKTFSGKTKVTDDTADPFTGKRAVVISRITPNQPGRVEFNGSSWLAEADIEIEPDTPVRITGKQNLTFTVEPFE
jgi:membrane protein implicated in regulation of membrane protease activity